MPPKNISNIDSSLTLEYLRSHPEGQYLERKGLGVKDAEPAKIANEIIGMLNAGGGVLVFGVSDTGELNDLKQLGEEKLTQYRKIIFDFIKPPANIKLEEVTLESGELLFLFHVYQDSERLFSRNDNENVFLRVADANKGPLDREQVRKLEYDKEIRKFEEEPREDFNLKDLRLPILEYYKKKINFFGTNEDLLVARNLAIRKDSTIICKNAAILLFAEDPDRYITNAYVRYVRYNGKEAKSGEEYNVIKDESFRGAVPRLIEILKKFIYASLRDYYYLDLEAGKFFKISEYPQEAWLEGVVNALCHRSYNVHGNCIYIKHFDDRLEISNSGPLPAQVTIENIRTERYARNPRMARVLSEMGYVRELNEGVPRIYESMKKSMLASPEYTVVSDTVKLLLRNKVSEHESAISESVMKKVEQVWPSYNNSQRRIISFLFEKQHATIDELSNMTGISKQAVRGYLNGFLEDAILSRKSPKIRDINAVYVFKKS